MVFTVTVRIHALEDERLVCSHIANEAAPATGSVTLRLAGRVDLCAECAVLAHRPGVLKFRMPGEDRRARAVPHRQEHIDRYIEEHAS
jgi:hypothetical protein